MLAATITLPKSLSERLADQAITMQMTPDALAIQILNDALIGSRSGSTKSSLKATNYHPPAKAKDPKYLEYLLANPPSGTMTFAEWEQFWPHFEDELKKFDLQDMEKTVKEIHDSLPG